MQKWHSAREGDHGVRPGLPLSHSILTTDRLLAPWSCGVGPRRVQADIQFEFSTIMTITTRLEYFEIATFELIPLDNVAPSSPETWP